MRRFNKYKHGAGAISLFIALTAVFSMLPVQARAAYAPDDVIGNVPTYLSAVTDPLATLGETDLGNVSADAARTALGTDVAILNGGDFINNLDSGEATYAAILSVFAEDRELAAATVTYKQLSALLEQGLSHMVLDLTDESIDEEKSQYDGFPQISGMEIKYDVSAPAGEKLVYIKISGEEIDLQDDMSQLTLAATSYMLGGGYDMPAAETYSPSGITLAQALAGYIAEHADSVTAGSTFSIFGSDARIKSIGSTDNTIIGYVPGEFLVIVLIVLIFFGGTIKASKLKMKEEKY